MENKQILSESQGYDSPEAWLLTEYCQHARTARQIAGTVGVTPETIRNWLKQYNIKVRPRGGYVKSCPRAVDLMWQLDTAQMTAREIADRVQCTPTHVRTMARRYGLAFRRLRWPVRCAWCGRVANYSPIEGSHGICPECSERVMAGISLKNEQNPRKNRATQIPSTTARVSNPRSPEEARASNEGRGR